ncbi:MAG: integral rane sensor signal transduction histidine kinase [bacterium]|nr:integral rane sensor signal transduction histidine kinase [bacterium]
MFARRRLLVLLLFEPMLAAVCLYTALTAKTVWLRDVSVGQLVALVVIGVVWWRRPARDVTAIRWALTLSLIATTGGATSPLLPLLVVLAVAKPSIVGCRQSLILTGVSIGVLWPVALVAGHGYLAAACASIVLLGGHQIGVWIRETSDETLRVSLEARDEAVDTHRERFAELAKLQAAVANDLKNPLTSIKGLLGLAELDPSRATERLGVLQKEVCRMQLILEDHLSFARPLTPLVAERVNVHAVVEWVVWLHDAIAREKQLRFDLSHVECVEISGDVRKLRQMLMHLVVNAIEASTRGGTVEITVRRDGDRVRIGVLDGGAGIDPALLPCACDPGVTTKEKGSGLGLTIVRALAEQHGGALALRNREGGGVAAEIDLPVDGAVAGAAEGLTAPKRLVQASTLRGPR